MLQIDWLDRLAGHRMSEVVSNLKGASNRHFITIELPCFEADVLYCELGGALPSQVG